MDEKLLREYLRYEPETGLFYWTKRTSGRGPDLTGRATGTPNTAGYILLKFKGERLYAHRIAWLFTYGYLPEYLDHKNGNPSDNRLCNLRECNQQQNLLNSDQLKRGVEKHGRWYRARVGARDKRVTIGSYATREEAQEAYNVYVTQMHGDFARVNRPNEHG